MKQDLQYFKRVKDFWKRVAHKTATLFGKSTDKSAQFLPAESNVFYFTDIHGDLNTYNFIINWCLEQDPNCQIIFGGDAADRDVHGYAIMKSLLNTPNIIYLKGNHEQLFVRGARAMLQLSKLEAYKHATDLLDYFSINTDVLLCLRNGGWSTLLDWWEQESDNTKEIFIQQIENLPLVYTYKQYDFCHAGGLPSYFQKIVSANYLADTEWHVLWDRTCLEKPWVSNRICVHGHTPQPSDPAVFNGRLDMDMGLLNTHRIAVLNATTNIIYVFSTTNYKVVKSYTI
jgi:hypothetical protein